MAVTNEAMNGMERGGSDGRDGARGRWLVLGIVGVALILGLVGLRFRKLTPRPAPATMPAATRSAG